jgi:hypothetical protein
MAKILILIENDCDPPIDGVSIAVNSISLLLEDHEVSYFIYSLSEFKLTQTSLPYKCTIESLPKFDIILTSPINSTLFFLKNKRKFKFNKCIALLSDCYTYAIWRQIILAYKFNFLGIKYFFITFLRMLLGYLKELRIAYSVDLLLFQTKNDVKIFRKIFPLSKADNIPNIPKSNNSGMELNFNRNFDSIAFVASFIGSYLFISDWFFKNVWPKVIASNTNAKIYLLGKGSKEYYQHLIKNNGSFEQSVILENYYPDISVFFNKMHMAVSPIFKGYGLINKTVEAMQNGCITIGDKTAFNGLNGIVSGENCFIADSSEEFVKMINLNFKNDSHDIRLNAKQVIYDELNRELYRNKINTIIDDLINS